MSRYGKTLTRTMKDKNEYVLYQDYAEIILYDKNKNEKARVVIDLDDIEKCKEYKWCGFEIIGSDKWEDDGKYSHSDEKGVLVEFTNDKQYKKIQSFNFGVCRCVSRCGSYFTDYSYTYYDYDFFEIKEVMIPEVIIPAHIEMKWNAVSIDLESIIDEQAVAEEIERKRLEIEQQEQEQKEAEIKAEAQRLRKLYPMNNSEIIKKVAKSLKKKGDTVTIISMRKEYFDIVVKGKLESQDWIDYYTPIIEKENS